MLRTGAIVMLGALAGLSGVALGGCGATARTTASAQPAYAVAGDAICAGQLARLNHLERPVSTAEMVSYLPPVLAVMHTETTRLAALQPPPGRRAELAAALSSTKTLSAVLSQFLTRLRTGMVEFAALTSLQARTTALRAQVDARFRRAGLSRCAE